MKNEVYTTYNAIVLSISSLFVLVFWYVLGVITFPKDWETHKNIVEDTYSKKIYLDFEEYGLIRCK